MSDSFVTPWTVACQAPLSMGFSGQEYRSGLPFPSLWDLPDPGSEPTAPAWQEDSLPQSYLGSPRSLYCQIKKKIFLMYYLCEKYYKPIYIGVPSKVLVGYLG